MPENARTAHSTPPADVRRDSAASRLLERARILCQDHFFATGAAAWAVVLGATVVRIRAD